MSKRELIWSPGELIERTEKRIYLTDLPSQLSPPQQMTETNAAVVSLQAGLEDNISTNQGNLSNSFAQISPNNERANSSSLLPLTPQGKNAGMFPPRI